MSIEIKRGQVWTLPYGGPAVRIIEQRFGVGAAYTDSDHYKAWNACGVKDPKRRYSIHEYFFAKMTLIENVPEGDK